MSESRDVAGRGDDGAVAQAFEQLPVVVGTVHGRDHVFVAANAAYRAFSAERPILGLPAREVFAEALSQQVFEMLDRAYVTGEIQSGREWRIQLDRGAGLVDIYIDFVISPITGPDVGDGTEVIGLNILITDITEQVGARQAAQDRAVEAERRYEAAQGVILELQRELLPAGVPVLSGVEVAASYLLADAETAAGGDWFDAVPLPDGRVALVVGDVVGHGVRASAVMGQLRVLLWDHLAESGSIDLALEAVDRFAGRVRDARAATTCVVVLDPDTGALDYATAGHPPPLVLPAHGEPRYLAATGDGPLATGNGGITLAHDALAPGDVVLLYTDGILERPGRDLPGASVELAQVAADVAAGRALRSTDPTTVERVTTQSLELLTRATGHTDDITLLAAQRTTPVPGLHVRTTATPPAILEVWTALATWLDTVHAAPEDVNTLQHAVGELVTNAVEHAYRDDPATTSEPGPVEVRATLDRDGQVRIRVRDEGRWREPDAPAGSADGRGRGLWMISMLVDDLTVEHPDGATEAFVGHRLTRPARLLTADTVTAGPAPATPTTSLVVEQEQAGRLRVAGPIDATTAPDVAAALAHAAAGGTRHLVVDLAGVTHLASAGVSVLFAAEARSLVNDVELLLHAPAGSPADQILTLVALAHTTDDPALGASAGDGPDVG